LRVLVIGAAGCLARALLPALGDDSGIESVTGVDRRPAAFSHPRFTHVVEDIRSGRVAALLAGHDALVHLACVVLRGRTPEAEMRAINVDASAALLLAAGRAGLRRLVLLSSAAVYGSGHSLAETAPLAPARGFAYARHKAELEAIVAERLPACARLRPHAILGAHAQPLLRFLLHQPFYPRLPLPEPPLQYVHEDDVAEAVLACLHTGASGAFNLAADPPMSFGEVVRAAHRYALPVPMRLARLALAGAWRAFGAGGEPAWIEGLARPLTLDCARAHAVLGWSPRHGTRELVSAAR